MKNLEKIYAQILGNPTPGDLKELEEKYREKSEELSDNNEIDRVDISTIQKCGELQNAYLYLKTQWAFKQRRESGILTDGIILNAQKKNTGTKTLEITQPVSKLYRLNKRLKSMARAGVILISGLSLYQVVNLIIPNTKLNSYSTILNSDDDWKRLVNEEIEMRKRVKPYPSDRETIDKSIGLRELDAPIINAAKQCDLAKLKSNAAGGNINFQNSLGESASHWLCRLNCSHGLKWAIENGADLSLRDRSGRSPSDWARINNSYESMQIINKYLNQ